jgi:putative oxidoreductase
MAKHQMFWVPFFHVAAMLTELVGGLSLLLGYKARLGALLLFLFLIPVTLTFHSFWTYTDPKEQQDNMLFFMHNLTLMGGLLLVMTFGPGPLSVDLKGRRPS